MRSLAAEQNDKAINMNFKYLNISYFYIIHLICKCPLHSTYITTSLDSMNIAKLIIGVFASSLTFGSLPSNKGVPQNFVQIETKSNQVAVHLLI